MRLRLPGTQRAADRHLPRLNGDITHVAMESTGVF